MMLAFVLIAGSLAAGAAILLLLPLMRRREDARPVAAISAAAWLFALLLGGGALYAAFSNFSWVDAPAASDTPAAAAARLSQELARHPDDIDGWLRLGNLYVDLEQYPLANRAFQRADRLAGNRNAKAITGMAEALLAQDFENIRGPAGRMFERVLELEPDNPKALLYGALAAMGRGENATARDRFRHMLALNPREDIRAIIEKQLQALDAAEAAPGGAVAAADSAKVQVRITLSTDLKFPATDQSALFIFARDPDQPGPPLAAKRLPLRFPVEVTLTAADAMMPERHIAAGQKLDIVARISLSGQPTVTRGDPFGRVGYHVGKDGPQNIVIDQHAP